MKKHFLPWNVDQQFLFPPSLRDFVSDDHLAHFVRDLVTCELNLDAIYAAYNEARGAPPYHPAMMTALLLYAYCQGIYSSRRIEKACSERVDFMAVTGMNRPDHSRINAFRQRHREALQGLFVQILALCREAGLAKLGHVALDGTKLKANASRHAAMSYTRMLEGERKLHTQVEDWLREADAADQREEQKHGAARGDELPDWVRNKQRKLEKIREAKQRLETQARELAKHKADSREERAKQTGRKQRGAKPLPPEDAKPAAREQSNFTDPESRIMKTRDGFQQSYNAQAAVDAESQVIVAQHVCAHGTDHAELAPTLDAIEANMGRLPRELSADSGYCSEENLETLIERGVRGYIATGKYKHGQPAPQDARTRNGPHSRAMRARLRRGGWASRYRLRKQSVEPVFGQIKGPRGFRQFLTRGLSMVGLEWSLLCTAHNVLKLAAAR